MTVLVKLHAGWKAPDNVIKLRLLECFLGNYCSLFFVQTPLQLSKTLSNAWKQFFLKITCILSETLSKIQLSFSEMLCSMQESNLCEIAKCEIILIYLGSYIFILGLLSCYIFDWKINNDYFFINSSFSWSVWVLHNYYIVCIGVSTPLQKHHLLFLVKPALNLQTVQAPPFRQSPYILVFHDPPPPSSKNQIFQWTPKILKSFILNTILSFKSN